MKNMSTKDNFNHWFREAAPYIQAHRDKTFVICLPGEAIDSDSFNELSRDIAGVSHLGIRLVLVHGIRSQVEQSLGKRNSEYHDGLRVTTDEAMACVTQQVGAVRLTIESHLSRALANLPNADARARTASGNYVTAKPYGIHDGIDYCHTGVVRRIDHQAIRQQLDAGAIAVISPVGFSPTGEIFNLTAEDVAKACATALDADKLILLSGKPVLRDSRRRLIRQLTEHEVQNVLHGRRKLDDDTIRLLNLALQALQSGIPRVHFLDWHLDGVLLQELFTRDGIGTLISAQPYDTIRTARTGDIPGIMQIIEKLEHKGVLVKRQRDRLEMEIDRFIVAIRDDAVIGCAALYPYEKAAMAELACLAVDDNYHGAGNGGQLLHTVQQRARQKGIDKLFVLTTQTAHWFKERGFKAARIADLPMAKRRLYNYQRNSKVFIKVLQ